MLKSVLVLFVCAGSACAESSFIALDRALIVPGGGLPDEPQLAVAGDTVNWAITAFSTAGGTFLHGPGTHTVGGSNASAGLPGTIGDVVVSSSVSTSASNVRTLVINMVTTSNARLAIGGLTIGGAVIDTVRFEVPGVNGGPNFFDDPYKLSAATGTFNLLGNNGAVIFSGAAGVTDNGTSFGLANGVTTGPGTNLFNNYITGGRFTITYTVPAPGSVAVLGLGGLAFRRRR
ncbi:MAG: hypothetical protein ACF8Q5_12390 [Phycisphaerales bacterium JB040]